MKNDKRFFLATAVSVTAVASAATGMVSADSVQANETAIFPEIFISEIAGRTANIVGDDGKNYNGYEYIEIYNHSQQAIDISDYQIIYAYPDPTMNQDWSVQESKLIQPGETLVVWIKNEHDTTSTIADFNANYGTELTEEKLAIISTAGIINNSDRTFSIQDKNGQTISYAETNGKAEPFTVDKAKHYTPKANSPQLTQVQELGAPSPGTIEASQIPSDGAPEEETGNTEEVIFPKVFITEIAGRTNNIVGDDGKKYNGYEYIEIYNHSPEAIDISDYQIIYAYSDPTMNQDWSIQESKIIQPGETLVVWIKNQHDSTSTIADFNENYGTGVTEENMAIISTAGIINDSDRTFIIQDANGKTISYAETNGKAEPFEVGKAKHFTAKPYSTQLTQAQDLVAPSPGTVESIQIPDEENVGSGGDEEQDEDGNEGVQARISHTPPTSITKSNIKLEANVTSDEQAESVAFYYRPLSQGNWIEKKMKFNEASGRFEVELTGNEIITTSIQYRMEATVNGKVITSDSYTVPVEDLSFDAQKVPSLLITELMPDSANFVAADGGKSNGYEYIEVYNNSDQPIDLSDYTIRLRYTGKSTDRDLIWDPDKRDVLLQPGETLVYWLITGPNEGLTIADFNEIYGSNLTEDQVVRIHSNGMINTSPRSVVIATNTGQDIAVATYYEQFADYGIKDTIKGYGIQYAYPQDGSTNMVKYSYGTQLGNPGTVDPFQIPAERRVIEEDTVAPSYQDLTSQEKLLKFEDLVVQYSLTDNQSIKTAQLFYKYKNQTEYHSIGLKDDGNGVYSYTIPGVELLGKGEVEYYLEMSDGTHRVTTDVKTVEIESSDVKASGLNLTDQSVVSGKVTVKSYGKEDRLFIGSEDVTAKTTPALPSDANFVFEANKIDNYFKNAVIIGDEVMDMYDYRITEYTTLSVPISSARIQQGKSFEISLRAGTKVSPFDEGSTENRDDFTIRNARLVLSDGTVIQDPNYAVADQELAVGDGSSATVQYDFAFDTPEQYFTANVYEWDTTKLTDGTYIVKAGTESIEVKIDNTAPVIGTTIEDGKEYKGSFTIEAEGTDDSSIREVQATLDGEEISLPYKTGSAQLKSGKHELTIEMTDAAGNKAVKTVKFSTTAEHPHNPEILSPVNGSTLEGTKANLKVRATDPTEDPMKVQFLEGFSYLPTDNEVKVYAHSSFTEPPAQMTSDDEQLITEEGKISETDQEYLEVTATDRFPYHRFEVEVDEAVDETDELLVDWVGKSLPGRKVSMYVWNYDANRWELQAWHVAEDDQNFELQASIFATEEFVKDNKVQVIVQDEIPSSATFDYSFVWMTDTQYYSESYPHIFDRMTSWIAQEKENLNLQYVVHTGDLVEKSYVEEQWKYADQYMNTLKDAGIPYGVLAGNHDVNHAAEDYTDYYRYFGADRFENETYYGGSHKNNRGHYDIINVNGNEFIFVYMGWGVNDEDMAWMNEVLADHPNSIAFLNFHEYLTGEGQRSTIGNQIFEKVVKPNDNVVAVLSGHIHDAETLVDELDDDGDGAPDRKVYQMLADYQGGPEGGQGYLRLLKVNQNNNNILVETYSPYLDDYNYYDEDEYPGKDQLTMEIDLEPQEKVVATDSFKVQVYTDTLLGEVPDVKSGETAETVLEDLAENETYGWHAAIQDEYDGQTRSTVQKFTTGTAAGNSNPNPGGGGNSGGGNSGGSHSGGGSGGSLPSVPDSGNKPNEIVIGTEQITSDDTIVVDAKSFFGNQNNEQDQVQFTFTSSTLDNLVANHKSLDVVGFNGARAMISPEALVELKEVNGERIQITIDESPDNVPQVVDGTTYAETLTIKIESDDKIVPLEQPIELKIPVLETVDSVYSTAVRFNDLTKQWGYAGGHKEAGYWVVPTRNQGLFTVASKAVQFEDVKGHWAEESITSLAAKFIINGKTDKLYGPLDGLTREQFTLLLARTLELPIQEYQGLFPDVNDRKGIDTLHLEAAKRFGIVQGNEKGLFEPNSLITREQMTAMLMRTIELVNPELLTNTSTGKKYTDSDSISKYAEEYVQQATKLQLLNGFKDGSFAPKENTTRAEAATVIQRFLKIVAE